MNTKNHSRVGWTLVEILFSVAVLGLAMAGAMSGWMYVIRGEKMNSVQNELDMDVRLTMERLKSQLRLSSTEKMYYYPAGVGPYTAISFPLARDDNGDGLIELDTNNLIIWDVQVIYHVWPAFPNELRQTVFDPRTQPDTLTAAQRQQQLNDTVAAGNGFSTFEGAGARTKALFKNLFTWEIRGKGPQYDAYNATRQRDVNVILGTATLTPGVHHFKFTVQGKNQASTGYRIGLDRLVVSPCGVPREAEEQGVYQQGGAVATPELMTSVGDWDNNYQLNFAGVAVSNYMILTNENDHWEETTFKGIGSQVDDAVVQFDEAYTPKDFVARLCPPCTNWYASDQTLDPTSDSSTNDYLRGAAVRVLVRGGNMLSGGAIKNSGPLHCIHFYASAASKLRILGAFISEAASETNYTPDAVDWGIRLMFSGYSSVDISAGNSAIAQPVSDFYIDKMKSYQVSYLVGDVPALGDSRGWDELHTSNPVPPGCYMIPRSELPDETMMRNPVWSTATNLTILPRLHAVQHFHVLCPTNGTFTSQIVDTHLTAPVYQDIAWTMDKPSGTGLGIKIRTGDQEDLSDALAWSNITAITAPQSINPGNKRYVQFLANFTPDSTLWYYPSLKNLVIRWTGQSMVADIGATVTQGPDYGIFDVMVDGAPLKRGLGIDLTIYEDVRGWQGGSNRLVSTVSGEVEPRNTGK